MFWHRPSTYFRLAIKDRSMLLVESIARPTTLQETVEKILEENPHVDHSSLTVSVSIEHRKLTIYGRVPSFYKKQCVQEAVRQFASDNDLQIANRTYVEE